MDPKPAGTVYITQETGSPVKVDLYWKTKDLQYIRKSTRELSDIAQEAGLPFKLRRNKLHYTGPKGKIEDYVLDLYELVLFENPKLADTLDGTFEKIIPEYAKYLRGISKERWEQVDEGNIEFDGYNFHVTDKALKTIKDKRNFFVDTAAYFSFLPERDSLKEKLKLLGVSLNKSKVKAVLAGGIMLAAGALGALLTKDVQADSPDKDTSSRQSGDYNPVYVANGYSPDWSPDGEQIVSGYYDIEVFNKDGTNKEEIVSAGQMGLENYCDPDWSPDGKNIIFWDYNSDTIYKTDESGNNMEEIGDGTYPHWSPDSKEIVYVSSGAIKTMNSDGSNKKVILSMDGLSDCAPSFSPDGSKITFNTEHGLYVMNSDGTNVKKIFDCGDKYCYYPIWSPDGQEVLFEQAEGWDEPNSGLYTINQDGTGLEKIIDLNSGGASADWFGSLIVYSDLDEPSPYGSVYLIHFFDVGKGQIEWNEGDYFIHLTDTHHYANNKRLEDFVDHVNNLEHKPKFVVVTGDAVDWGAGDSGTENFQDFFQILDGLETTWYIIPGNHDCRYGVGNTSIPIPLEGDMFENYYELVPANRDLTSGKADYGSVVVFGVNSGWDELNLDTSPFPPEGSGLSDTQVSSLEEKFDMLDGVRDGKDSSGKIKVVVMHHPTHWQNDKGKDDGVFLHNRGEFTDLCEQDDVDVVLAGHTHKGAVRDDGTKFVVTGAAGDDAVYRKITYTEKGLKVEKQQFFKETTTGKIDCPAKLTMYDSTGKKVNSEAQELPGSFYSGWEINGDRTETVSAYGTGEYIFEIKGTGNGTINFTINQNGEQIFSTEPLSVTDKTKLEFTTLENKVHVEVDKNGDGKPEKKFDVSDGKLTREEFKAGQDNPVGIGDSFGYVVGGVLTAIGLGGLAAWYRQRKIKKELKRAKEKPDIDKVAELPEELSYDDEYEKLYGNSTITYQQEQSYEEQDYSEPESEPEQEEVQETKSDIDQLDELLEKLK